MTCFVLSHNPQIFSETMTTLSAVDISGGLSRHSSGSFSVTALSHPHWVVKVESLAGVDNLAKEILQSWRNFRHELGDTNNYIILALGGRKDTVASLESPLKQGFWGVDVIETGDPQSFLSSINWSTLKKTRSTDSIFEAFNYPE